VTNESGRGHRAALEYLKDYKERSGTHETESQVSHDEAIIRRLRKDADFAAEYLKAALEDEDEPRVLLIALRHLAQAQASPKSPRPPHRTREPLSSAIRARQPRLSTLVAVTKAIG